MYGTDFSIFCWIPILHEEDMGVRDACNIDGIFDQTDRLALICQGKILNKNGAVISLSRFWASLVLDYLNMRLILYIQLIANIDYANR